MLEKEHNGTRKEATLLCLERGMEPELTFGGNLGPFCTGLYIPWDPKPTSLNTLCRNGLKLTAARILQLSPR